MYAKAIVIYHIAMNISTSDTHVSYIIFYPSLFRCLHGCSNGNGILYIQIKTVFIRYEQFLTHNHFHFTFFELYYFFQRDLLSNDVISSWQKVIDMLSMIITLFFTNAFHINKTPLFPYWFRCSDKNFYTRRYWLVKAILIWRWCWFTPRVFTQNVFLLFRLKSILK